MNKIRWCAIGDSFTYLNDHSNETGFRVKTGYLDRTCQKVGGLIPINMGINGSETKDWSFRKPSYTQYFWEQMTGVGEF